MMSGKNVTVIDGLNAPTCSTGDFFYQIILIIGIPNLTDGFISNLIEMVLSELIIRIIKIKLNVNDLVLHLRRGELK
jgi:hypothetical protein